MTLTAVSIRAVPARLATLDRGARPAAWFVAVLIPAVGVHTLIGTRLADQIATTGEARLAAAIFAAQRSEVTSGSLPFPDVFAARQLAAVEAVLPGIGSLPVIDAARMACLVVGLIGTLLLWPAARRLGLRPAAAAVTVAIGGVLPPVVALHGTVDPGVLAGMWLALAAAWLGRGRAFAVGAALAVLLAVLTVPLAAAVVLALAAHALTVRVIAAQLADRMRLLAAAGCAAAAALIAVLSITVEPLRGIGGATVSTGVAAGYIGVGLVIVGLGWWRVPWLRPVVTPGALLLVCAAMPGPARSTALLLAIPILSVIAGSVVDSRLNGDTDRPRLALSLALIALVLMAGQYLTRPPEPSARTELAGWASTALGAGTTLRVDPLEWAELAKEGVSTDRLRSDDGPVRSGELIVVSSRPDSGSGVAGTSGCGADALTVASIPSGSGGAATSVCTPNTPGLVDATAADSLARLRFEPLLAGNDGLDLADPAGTALRDGRVDARLATMLAAIVVGHRLAIADFPAADLEPPSAPRRTAVITTVDGMTPTAGASQLIEQWMEGQQAPYRPDLIRHVGDSLIVSYSAPSPLGLLPG